MMRKLFLVTAILGLGAGGLVAEEAKTLKLWYDKPAKEWTEALPIGNGRFGAMVFGGVAEARFQFNDDTLFSGQPHDYAHKGAVKYLPELRRLLYEGKQNEAHKLGNEVICGMSENLQRRCILMQLTIIHYGNPISQAHSLIHVMRYEDHSLFNLFFQFEELVLKLRPGDRI